jgi:type I restriction enzyme, S subunit
MTRGVTPYAAMRQSGVPWLGAVPSHWERRRLKSLLRPIDRRSSTGTETLLSLRRDHGIVVFSEHFSRPAQGATTVGYKIVNKGQLVVNRLQANNGLVFDSSLDGLVSPDYSVFEHRRSDQILMPYLSLLLRTPTYRDHFRRESTGLGTGSAGFLRLYDDRFLVTPVVLPPTGEQASILRFLDHADRRIRRYIRVKQKLIKLLEEQKQAIIHRAVTRGLAADLGFTSSGVPGWPPIPRSYRRVRLGRVCLSIRDGTHNPPPAVPGMHRLLSVRNIIGGRFVVRSDDRTMTPTAFDDLQRSYDVRRGDVVIALVGATTGKSAVVEDMDNVTVQRSIGILRPDSRAVGAGFLNLVIRSELVQGQIRQVMNKYAAQPGIYLEEVGRLQICFPDLKEQRAILDQVASESAPLDAATEQASSEINLLKEYRTRLIADVITGKLDVREAVARLPEEVEESEPLDEGEGAADAVEVDEGVEAVAEEAEA